MGVSGLVRRIAPVSSLRVTTSREVLEWAAHGAASPAPQEVKMAVLARHGIVGSTWIETGTGRGRTTAFLATDPAIASTSVITVEPSEWHYRASREALAKLTDVRIIHATSEDALPGIIELLQGPACFWLDGHYSGGRTFPGATDTPILTELALIETAMDRLRPLRVFVDDVRLFVATHRETDDPDRDGYPPLQSLVDWAVRNDLRWLIEQDIFIACSD